MRMGLVRKGGIIYSREAGFTIVELLIVIVVIAILAAISIATFTGIQRQARDTARVSDVDVMRKGLELYYLDNGHYPSNIPEDHPYENEKVADGVGVARSNCSNWKVLSDDLEPYLGSPLPADPRNNAGSTAVTHTYYYWPVPNNTYLGCTASAPYQSYILEVFNEAGSGDQYTYHGKCASEKKPTSYYGSRKGQRTYFVTKP
jgi:prepilin-type N-terminal cleavage/methylation domain-containing protein